MIEHDFFERGDGLIWCETEGVPSDFCSDEDRCSSECICNVSDPGLRDEHYDVYLGVYGGELKAKTIQEQDVMAMALHSARQAEQDQEN